MKKLSLNLFKFFILVFFILCSSAHSEVKFVSSNIEKVIITDGDSLKIGKGKPGPLTCELMKLYETWMSNEI